MLTSPSKAVDRRPAPGGPRQRKNAHKSVSKNRAAIKLFLGYDFFTELFMIWAQSA
jgi:hypothetical protein